MISFFLDEDGAEIRVVGFNVSLVRLSAAINTPDIYILDTYDDDIIIVYPFSLSTHSVVVSKTRVVYPEEKLVFDPALDALIGQDAVTDLLLSNGIRDNVASACLNLGVRLDADPELVEYAALRTARFISVWSAIVWFNARGLPVPTKVAEAFKSTVAY